MGVGCGHLIEKKYRKLVVFAKHSEKYFYCTCLHKLSDYAPLRDLIEQAALELEQNNSTLQCVNKVKFPEEINDINIKSEVS